MEKMEQFSHDLTLALEETSRCTNGSRWGIRRRTRSTGNLPCPPQPTEDSSSSPTDPPNDNNNNHNHDGAAGNNNSIQSDSDDRHSFAYAFKLRQTPMSGNFESDSLNENFSPSRPNIRRKRKFKRMAVEYETTPSTPHTTTTPIFPISGTVKKRVLKHTCQENFKSNLFYCGKRKRPHRERYMDYDSHKHSSSVPRQRSSFLSHKDGGLSYLEYKSRNRASSMSAGKPVEKIMPLNKSIVSKIEKISQDTKNKMNFNFTGSSDLTGGDNSAMMQFQSHGPSQPSTSSSSQTAIQPSNDIPRKTSEEEENDENKTNHQKMAQKSGSFESALPSKDHKRKLKHYPGASLLHHPHKHKHSKRRELRMELQFDDQNFMDCGNINDFLSSSSLSSSDSEAVLTNESDHEGDDELTDWPANEVMINFASKNEFKRANKSRMMSKLPQIRQQEDPIQDEDDTLMDQDEVQSEDPQRTFMVQPPATQVQPPNSLNLGLKYSPLLPWDKLPSNSVSRPINISGAIDANSSVPGGEFSGNLTSYQYKTQIESEMSGETSNHFLSSPNTLGEIREIRAGCRRIREERPGFSIITSFNEELLKFLQDDTQRQLKISDVQEYDKIFELAKLYSLNFQTENNCIILNKTSNTMQSVKVEHGNFTRHFFSDFKRRCVDADSESNEMAT